MIKRLSAKRGDEGFTLIELLVVVVILGILAAVVVFAVGGITNKGQQAADDTDKQTLITAEEAHYAQIKSNPTYATEAALVTEKLLSAASSTWDICVKSDGSAYTIVSPTATCATGYAK